MDEMFIEELSVYKHVTTNITQYWNVLLLLPSWTFEVVSKLLLE